MYTHTDPHTYTQTHTHASLTVTAYLETSGAPVDELDAAFCLDGGNGAVDILGHNVTTEEQAAGHVLAMTGVALHHLIHRHMTRLMLGLVFVFVSIQSLLFSRVFASFCCFVLSCCLCVRARACVCVCAGAFVFVLRFL